MTDGPIRYVNPDGSPVQPEPGPIWLESYQDGERMYVPGWVWHCPGCGLCQWHGLPHVIHERLEGPGLLRLPAR